MPVEAERIILLDKDVETAVIIVPGVSDLFSLLSSRLVQRHLHSDGQGLVEAGAGGDAGAGAGLEVTIAITLDLLHASSNSSSHSRTPASVGLRSAGALSGSVVSLTVSHNSR